ncbi:MAG: PKD domain-containing protein, partial [Acidobacteria bacterium]|nr:PKD domain-containing protein [Acidobacteriota bacterium]
MRFTRLLTFLFMLACIAVPANADTPKVSKDNKKETAKTVVAAAPAKKAEPAAKMAVASAPKPVASSGTTVPKADLFLGYQFLRFNQKSPINGMNMNGGDANVGINFRDTGWGFVLDFSGGHGSRQIAPGVDQNGNAFTYLFGPRYSWRKNEKVVPFLQTLFGGMRADQDVVGLGSNSQNSFAWTAGGGFDWIATPRIGWRILQAEYMMSRFDGPTLSRETQNNIRIMSGIIFRLGAQPPPPPPAPNRNPSASCSAAKSSVYAGSNEVVSVTASASDPDNDSLSYSWSANGGTVEGSGATVRWNSRGASVGTYRVGTRVSDGKGGTATCDAEIRVEAKPNAPPTMSCSAERSTVLSGERARINARASDPDGDNLTYSWRTTGGQIVGSGSSVQLDTSGLSSGSYAVTGRVEDGRGGAADCTATVNVSIPPPPPQASKINECLFRASSARVDNVCKRILDDVATRLNSESTATVVLIGYADPKEG